MKNKILITGGTGLVGQRLTEILLEEGYQVSYLSRKKSIIPKVTVYTWDIKKQEIEREALEKADHIIHLAGAGIADEKWTESRKKVILESRTQSTQLLYNKMKAFSVKPKSFISASAIGIYGFQTGSTLLQENSPHGNDFLADVTRAWEDEIAQIATLGVRTAWLRIGIVLSEKGGALPKIAQPIRFGAGAPLASGEQYLSWIHIDDLCRMFLHAIENNLEGAYNAVGNQPATNEDFTKIVAKVLGRPLILPNVPQFVLKLMLGEMANMVIGGNNVSNEKILKSGFSYEFDNLKDAVEDLLKSSSNKKAV